LPVADGDLAALTRALRDGAIEAPLTPTALQAAGFEHLVEPLVPYLTLSGDALAILFETVLAERHVRRGPKVKLVWSGDDGRVSHARYTSVVVPELFTNARKHVLLAGYSFDHGAQLFAPLHAVMRGYGVQVDLFLDLAQLEDALDREARRATVDWGPMYAAATSATAPSERARGLIELFFALMWPFGPPRPRVYYDPRTAQREARMSLHAKCVVIDHEVSLVTSANFTDRGQTRNLEAGVLVEDTDFAESLERQWGNLVQAGIVVPSGG
jgi:phosphatidylserine/phosphatidylglycerophosphate/cardiolipin synthase-like enzyme